MSFPARSITCPSGNKALACQVARANVKCPATCRRPRKPFLRERTCALRGVVGQHDAEKILPPEFEADTSRELPACHDLSPCREGGATPCTGARRGTRRCHCASD